MNKEILSTLNLPPDPVGSLLRLVVKTEEGNQRKFLVTIQSYRFGAGYIELYISSCKIKKVRFDRLLHRISGEKLVGEWVAQAQIPAPDEHDWIRSWEVLTFQPLPAAR